MPKAKDEIAEFEAALLRSIDQANSGEVVVHTPEVIKRRGRPPGSVQAVTKTPVKLRLDDDVLEALRASGSGWQTRTNDALRAWLKLSGSM